MQGIGNRSSTGITPLCKVYYFLMQGIEARSAVGFCRFCKAYSAEEEREPFFLLMVPKALHIGIRQKEIRRIKPASKN